MLKYGARFLKLMKQIKGGVDYFGGRLDTHFNMKKDFRKMKLGDDRTILSTNPMAITMLMVQTLKKKMLDMEHT